MALEYMMDLYYSINEKKNPSTDVVLALIKRKQAQQAKEYDEWVMSKK